MIDKGIMRSRITGVHLATSIRCTGQDLVGVVVSLSRRVVVYFLKLNYSLIIRGCVSHKGVPLIHEKVIFLLERQVKPGVVQLRVGAVVYHVVRRLQK